MEQHRRQDARPQSANELIAFAQRLTRFGLWFGGALILAAAVLIGVDVTLRKFFNASIGGADELAGYALALGTAWSLGAAHAISTRSAAEEVEDEIRELKGS